jgi:excisionase family DNA binding protein
VSDNTERESEPLVLTIKEAAAELRVSYSTMRTLIRRGDIAILRPTRQTRLIPYSELKAYVARKLAEAHAEQVAS